MNEADENGLIEAVAFCQGSMFAEHAVLMALVMTHPNPTVLLDAFRRCAAPRIASAQLTTSARGSEAIVEREEKYRLQHWEEQLADLARRAPPKG